MFNFKTLTLGLAVMAGLSAAIPAQATTTPSDQVEIRIRVADLQTERGLLRVYAQLNRKAERACGVTRGTSLSERNAARECASGLLEDFISDLDNADLTRLHKERKNS